MVPALPRLAFMIGQKTRVAMKTSKKRSSLICYLVGVRMQPEMAKHLDGWRRQQDGLPGRPETIRRLVELGLKAKK